MNPDRLRRVLHLQPGRPAIAFGLRAATAVCAPLILATLADQLLLGLGLAIGGLNASMADVGGTYRSRAAAMGATALGGAGAMFLGTVVSSTAGLAVAVVFVVSFACAMVSIYGNAAALAGLLINVALLVGAGFGGDLHDSATRGALFLAGGLGAMVIALLLWPLHPDKPSREAVASAYRALAAFLAETSAGGPGQLGPTDGARAAVRPALDTARQTLAAARTGSLGSSASGVCLLLLVRAAERMALATVALTRVLDSAAAIPGFAEPQPVVRAASAALAEAVAALAVAIAKGGGVVDLAAVDRALAALDQERDAMRTSVAGHPDTYHGLAVYGDVVEAVGTVADSLRTAAALAQQLASGQRPRAAVSAPDASESAVRRALGTLTAQLCPRSIAFRHAVRLALALAAGVVVYTVFALPRGFWVTITIAFILKPNFGGTIDFTAQRVGGTLLGAAAAAALVAAVRAPLALEVLLFPITVACVAVWRLSYLLFITLFTPLMLVLAALPDPGNWTLAGARIVDTLIGVAITLVATYLLWPSWARDRLPRQLGATMQANRDYLRGVVAAYLGKQPDTATIPAVAQRAVLENGNSAVMFQQLLTEPRDRRGPLEQEYELVAYNQQLCDAITSLAAHVPRYSGHHALPGFELFGSRATDALSELAEAVESGRPPAPLPSLDEPRRTLHAHLQQVEAARAAELAAQRGDTPTLEAVHDFTRVSAELECIAREVTGMQLALEGR